MQSAAKILHRQTAPVSAPQMQSYSSNLSTRTPHCMPCKRSCALRMRPKPASSGSCNLKPQAHRTSSKRSMRCKASWQLLSADALTHRHRLQSALPLSNCQYATQFVLRDTRSALQALRTCVCSSWCCCRQASHDRLLCRADTARNHLASELQSVRAQHAAALQQHESADSELKQLSLEATQAHAVAAASERKSSELQRALHATKHANASANADMQQAVQRARAHTEQVRCVPATDLCRLMSDLSFVSLPDVADHVGPSSLLKFSH